MAPENSQETTEITSHPQHQQITRTAADHKFTFGTSSGFNNSKTNSASPMQSVRTFTHVSYSQPEKYPALGDPTNTKVTHSNATLLSLW